MARRMLKSDVLAESVARMERLYREGHRIVVGFSGGKDSGICVEVCSLASAAAGCGPVEVAMRDEEIMLPGTFEYAERMRERTDVAFHWLIAGQPVINVFNRREPYFWVFDTQVPSDVWVRQPPTWGTRIADISIDRMITPARFPPAPGKDLIAVTGLRVSESKARLYGVFAAGGYLTKPNKIGVRYARPIYDWADGDVWRGISENRWDYNSAYNKMLSLGVKPQKLRIGPPTMNVHAAENDLRVAAQAWPQWFERVCQRLPGVRTAAMFGKRAVQPSRRSDETWEQCFRRECLRDVPAQWLRDRATMAMDRILSAHGRHSTSPLPEVKPCPQCTGNFGAWKKLALSFYNGDPFGTLLPHIEPEFFRKGAGTWGGSPSW